MFIKEKQTRTIQGAVRSSEITTDGDGRVHIPVIAVRYNVLDEFQTVFEPGMFEEDLAERMPTVAWAHDWSDIIGKAVDYQDTPEGPIFDSRMSDFDAVPRARQAWSQVEDGTVTDVSIGFSNAETREITDDDRKKWPGVRAIFVKAQLDEYSLVLRGAVPGAKTLVGAGRSIRSSRGLVDENFVFSLAKKVKAGELTQDEAEIALNLAAVDEDGSPAKDDGKGTGDDGKPANGDGSDDGVVDGDGDDDGHDDNVSVDADDPVIDDAEFDQLIDMALEG